MKWLKKYSEILIITTILLLALFLRFYKLSEIPNGFYVDEAAIGYNSYSLLETGRDEYGKTFPIILRSYTMFAPPLYTYFTMLPIKLFGLSIFSVRFISALSGVLSTLIIYFICKQIHLFHSKATAYIAAFLYAISPWSIFFSRGAFEANLAFFLLSLGIFFALLTKKNRWNLVVSFLFLSLSTYAYHANRLLSILVGFGILVWFVRGAKWKGSIKQITLAIILFLIVQIPYLTILNTEAFQSRATGLLYLGEVERQSETIRYLPSFISYPLSFAREFFAQYIAYYSPKNLFFIPESDLQRSVPELSVWYFWMVIPYIIGLYLLIKRFKEKNVQLLWFLFLTFPIPAALTKDPFSSLRALSLMLPTLLIIVLGIEHLLGKIPKKFGFLLSAGIVCLSGILLWRSYFILFPTERAVYWDYGFSQVAGIIHENPDTHYLVDQSRLEPPYILLAFHLKLPPQKLQAASDPSIKNDYYNGKEFNSTYSFSNIETRNIIWEEDIYKEQVLVGDSYAISEDQAKEHKLTKVFEIEDPLHEVVFVGYQTNPTEKCKLISYTNKKCLKP